jgi:hypothetical protein
MSKKANNRLRVIVLWVAAAMAIVLASVMPSVLGLTTFGQTVLLPAGFWTGVGFIIFYTMLAPWWRTPMGKMIVSFDFAFVLITSGTTFREEFGVSFSNGAAVRILFAALIIAPLVIVSRVILLGELHDWKIVLPWKHDAPEEFTSPEMPGAAEQAQMAEPG